MEKALGGLRKLKLFNKDSYANTHFYVIESHKRFFSLFQKFLVIDLASYDDIFFGYPDKLPKDISEVQDLIYNFSIRLGPKLKIIFGTERIILVFFDEDKDKIEKKLKSIIDFDSLKESNVKCDSF